MITQTEHIKQTIEYLHDQKRQLAEKIAIIGECINNLEELDGFNSVEAEKPSKTTKRRKYKKKTRPTKPQNKPKQKDSGPKLTDRPTKKSKKAGGRISSQRLSGKRFGKPNPFSEYKGVTRGKPKKDGTVMYRASVWDGRKNKNILLGTFSSELLAAAAVADHRGDKAEVIRLRALAKQQQDVDMAEQLENNPDRAAAAVRKKKTKTIYVCKRCGLQYKSKGTCAECGNDDFREVQSE